MPQQVIKSLELATGSPSLPPYRYRCKQRILIASFKWHYEDQFTYRMPLHRGFGSVAAGKETFIAPSLTTDASNTV